MGRECRYKSIKPNCSKAFNVETMIGEDFHQE